MSGQMTAISKLLSIYSFSIGGRVCWMYRKLTKFDREVLSYFAFNHAYSCGHNVKISVYLSVSSNLRRCQMLYDKPTLLLIPPQKKCADIILERSHRRCRLEVTTNTDRQIHITHFDHTAMQLNQATEDIFTSSETVDHRIFVDLQYTTMLSFQLFQIFSFKDF